MIGMMERREHELLLSQVPDALQLNHVGQKRFALLE